MNTSSDVDYQDSLHTNEQYCGYVIKISHRNNNLECDQNNVSDQ